MTDTALTSRFKDLDKAWRSKAVLADQAGDHKEAGAYRECSDELWNAIFAITVGTES